MKIILAPAKKMNDNEPCGSFGQTVFELVHTNSSDRYEPFGDNEHRDGAERKRDEGLVITKIDGAKDLYDFWGRSKSPEPLDMTFFAETYLKLDDLLDGRWKSEVAYEKQEISCCDPLRKYKVQRRIYAGSERAYLKRLYCNFCRTFWTFRR